MIETLGGLHSIEPAAVVHGNFGPLGNYFERQAARLMKQYRAAATEHIEEVERLTA